MTKISHISWGVMTKAFTVSFIDSLIDSIILYETGIQLISTSLVFQNTAINNLSSNQGLNLIQTLLNWNITITSCLFNSSLMTVINSYSTSIQLNNFTLVNVTSIYNMFSFSESNGISISNMIISSSMSQKNVLFSIVSWSNVSITSFKISNIQDNIFYLKNSNVNSLNLSKKFNSFTKKQLKNILILNLEFVIS